MLDHRELKLLNAYFSLGISRDKLERLKSNVSLKMPLMPMKVVLDTQQVPAVKSKIFILNYSSEIGHSISPIERTSPFNPPLDGRFLFVILASDPARVYCGLAYDPINQYMNNISSRGKQGVKLMGNIFNSADRCEIEGHTSLTQSKDVLFAGDLLFCHGRLLSWRNASGHYQPKPESRYNNLYPNVKKALPESLFKAFDFEGLSTAGGGERNSGSNSSASSRHLSDFSSLSSFGSNYSGKSNISGNDNW